jgi:hypothetical protein
LNTKHHVIAQKTENEVKGSINLEKLFAKKCLMCIQVKYNKKIGPKRRFKNDYVKKKVFAKPWSFDCEKLFAYVICEKYMVEVIVYAFVFLSSFFH